MTVSRRAKVKLTLKALTFVTTPADFERGPDERTLVADQDIVRRLISWAEALGWRNPDNAIVFRYAGRPAVAALVSTLRAAIDGEPPAPSTSKTRMTTRNQLAEFFAVAANRRRLVRVLDFLAAGGELTVEGA